MIRLLFPLLFLFVGNVYAQEFYRLRGYVRMQGGNESSYFAQFTVKDTRVSGFAITRYNEGSRLRASLTGRMVSESQLYIDESGFLDEPDPYQTWCYFRARLKRTVVNGRHFWSGDFEGHLMDGQACTGGFMFVSEEDTITAINVPVRKSPVINIPLHVATPEALAAVTKPPVVANVAAQDKPAVNAKAPDGDECARSYNWTSDSLSLDIWDGWTIDGDVVSLALNGQLLLDHQKLSEIKQHLVLPLATGKNLLQLYLFDEGSEPPNTPDIVLTDGKIRHELSVSGNSGEQVRICINRLK